MSITLSQSTTLVPPEPHVILSGCEESPGLAMLYEILRSGLISPSLEDDRWEMSIALSQSTTLVPPEPPVILSECEESPSLAVLLGILRSVPKALPRG